MKNSISLMLMFWLCTIGAYAQNFSNQLTASGLEVADKNGQIKEIFDYNNDGYEDIIFATKTSIASLYKNNGNGTFTNASTNTNFPTFKTAPTTLLCTDIDNNGYRDLVYYYTHGGGAGNDTLRIFTNSNGVFTERTTDFGIKNPIMQGTNHWNSNIAPMDFDRDGDLDILFSASTVTASNSCTNSKICVLVNNLENTLKPRFNKIIELISLPTNILPMSIATTDYNNDQMADIVTCEQSGANGSFSGYRADPFVLYRNKGDGTFEKVLNTNLADAALHNFITVWDYNNDGWLDFINGTSDCCGTRTNIIWRNNANGTFSDMRSTYNLHPVNDYYNRLSAVDYNNDGFTDISTTMLGGYWGDTRHQLWENNGTTFSNTAVTNGIQLGYNGGFNGIGTECEWFDYNNDGNLDFYSYIWNSGPNQDQSLMKNNNTAGNKYLRIKLIGTISPKDGTGSKVVVKSGNQRMTQYNNAKIGNNFSDIYHFGLGQNNSADSVYVYWSSGSITKMASITANQQITITEPQPAVPTSAKPIQPDENTVLLDHFDKASCGQIQGSATYVTGLTGLGNAINLSTGSSYVRYASGENLEQAGTVEMWVYLTKFDAGILNINWNNFASLPGSGHVFHLRIDSVGSIGLSGWGTDINNSFNSRKRVKLNEWTHIAVSWGDSTKIYINGTADIATSTAFRPAIVNSTNYYYLPYWGENSGYIDELQISKIKRTASEIASRIEPRLGLSRTCNLAGSLSSLLSTDEKKNAVQLKITGKINATDFKTIRDELPVIEEIDLSETTIEPYSGSAGTGFSLNYQANTIPENAFFNYLAGAGKLSLTKIMLPQQVQLIDKSAFENCRNLQNITLYEGIRFIADYAFNNCRNLIQINFPQSTYEIGASSFENCRSLTNIVLPDQTSFVGSSAFWGCTGITNVSFGSNLTSIGEAAFWGCYKVNTIQSKALAPPSLAGNQVFGEIDKAKCELTVPPSAVLSYSQAPQWKDFFMIETEDNKKLNDEASLIIMHKNGKLEIECNNTINICEIFNTSGQLVSRTTPNNKYVGIKLGTPGLYIVKVQTPGSPVKALKVII